MSREDPGLTSRYRPRSPTGWSGGGRFEYESWATPIIAQATVRYELGPQRKRRAGLPMVAKCFWQTPLAERGWTSTVSMCRSEARHEVETSACRAVWSGGRPPAEHIQQEDLRGGAESQRQTGIPNTDAYKQGSSVPELISTGQVPARQSSLGDYRAKPPGSWICPPWVWPARATSNGWSAASSNPDGW